MKNERIFRTVTALLLVSAMSISGYNRRRAERTGGERAAAWREEGWPLAVALRASGFAMWLSVLAYVLNPRWMEWSRLEIPSRLRWVGAGTGMASLPLFYWIFGSLGENITPTVSTRKDHRLVTSGPYRWVRHPLYSAGTVFCVSLNLLVASWFTALTGATALALLLVRLPKEEEKLIERFGDEYRVYAKRTGRLLPRLG
jgi:protein-S-isoprenylcysteine O-methyltransferase Ste14